MFVGYCDICIAYKKGAETTVFSTRTFQFGRKLAEHREEEDGSGWVLAESAPNDQDERELGLYWYPGTGKLGFPSAFNRPAWFNIPKPVAEAIRVSLPVLMASLPPGE